MIGFILAVLFQFLFPFQSSTQPEWYTLESPHFKFYFTSANQTLAATLPELFENEYNNLSATLSTPLDSLATVLLAPTEEKFNELTGYLIPHWGEGVADPSRNLIIIKANQQERNRDRLIKLVRHEIIHILIGRSVAKRATSPRWFDEGLAIYFSYDEDFAGGSAISKAIISNSIIPLSEIEDVLKFHTEKARLAYEESYSAVLYFEEEYGFVGITAIISDLQNGSTFDDAFASRTGLPLADFELNWLRFVERKYRWRFLLDFETYLWIFMVLLFVLGFAAIKWRNRQTLKRWEAEDRGNPD